MQQDYFKRNQMLEENVHEFLTFVCQYQDWKNAKALQMQEQQGNKIKML